MTDELPPEIQFVTTAVSPEPDIGRLERLAAGEIVWERVINWAIQRHKVGPLLYRNLTEHGTEPLLPKHVLDQLRRVSRQTAMRNLSLTNSLLSILGWFEAEGIPALPYKGPVLSESIYEDFTLRQSRDLDILVRPDDLYAAEAVLCEKGFEPDGDLTPKHRKLLKEHYRQRTLRKDGTIVELHPRVLSSDAPFSVSTLLERSRSISVAGETIQALGLLDNLLLLSVHGTWHQWSQLKWICDIGYLLKRASWDWKTVFSQARQRECYRRVSLGCWLATTVLNVELPESVQPELPSREDFLADATYPGCLLDDRSLEERQNAKSVRYIIRSRDSIGKGVSFCLKSLTTPAVRKEHEARIPDQLFELNYLIHPLRLLGERILRPLRK